MEEYYTEAIVLDKEDSNAFDWRVSLYTKNLGKIVAKATSARKIVSKLNPHLEPLNLIKLRLVHKNNFQIVDALTINNFTNLRQSAKLSQAIDLLHFVKEMTVAEESDYQLWSLLNVMLAEAQISYRLLLRVLGFDSQFAVCDVCQRQPHYFLTKDCRFSLRPVSTNES